MKINDERYIEKKEFVTKLSEVLNLAKPHLTCEFKLGEELPKRKGLNVDGEYVEYQPSGEFVVVTARNGYQYEVNVTADSLAAIAEEVFTKMVCK